MCIEFQHLSCQLLVIKGLAYLLILLQLLLLLIAKMTRNRKTRLTLAMTGKIYFRIPGLGLGSVALHVSGLGLGLLALALTPLALLTSLNETVHWL